MVKKILGLVSGYVSRVRGATQ